jgi:putative PIN family toxin of toxin-antitoxin system
VRKVLAAPQRYKLPHGVASFMRWMRKKFALGRDHFWCQIRYHTHMVVIDTNVFVSACMGQGASAKVVAGCLRGEITPLMGAALLAEFEDVLSRVSLFNRSRLNAIERSELLDIFLGTAHWTRIYFGWRPNLRDEADNHLVELAVAGGASHIITHNIRDFVASELRFHQFSVLTPTQFLQEQNK